MKISVLSLVFLPLTFGYAIFRYRLMDVDLIFKRGMATPLRLRASIVRPVSAVARCSRSSFRQKFPSSATWGWSLRSSSPRSCSIR